MGGGLLLLLFWVLKREVGIGKSFRKRELGLQLFISVCVKSRRKRNKKKNIMSAERDLMKNLF